MDNGKLLCRVTYYDVIDCQAAELVSALKRQDVKVSSSSAALTTFVDVSASGRNVVAMSS